MELPFTIVFEPPSHQELRAMLRMRGIWVAGVLVALAIGTAVVVVAGVGRADAVASAPGVRLELTSHPAGAGVWLDGREQAGRTPLVASVEPGSHSLVLKARDAVDGAYTLQASGDELALDVVLWRRAPTLSRLRPALPGAVLSDVRILSDGQLALSLALPAGRQLQAWRLEPLSGALEPLLPEASGTRVAVASDGQHVAYVGYELGPQAPGFDVAGLGDDRPSIVWLVPHAAAAPGIGWRAPVYAGEQVLDASWSPLADRLLVTLAARQPGGATRTRVWLVDADGRAGREVLSLPSEVVAGTQLWSPDGRRVAFLAHAGAVNALCLLDLDSASGFRYAADLDVSAAAPLPYLAATWSADSQRLLFVAPQQRPPGAPFNWVQPDTRRTLYEANVAEPAPVGIGLTTADLVIWRADGQLVGLGRRGDGVLELSLLAPGGSVAQPLVDLPLTTSPRYAAAWDTARARVLVATPDAAGKVEYWLVSLALEALA